MFTTIARKVVTLTVAAATVTTLSLSVVTPAQAGMFSFDFGVDISGPLMIHNPEDNIDYQSDLNFGPKFYDKQWDKLTDEDNQIHLVINTTKLTNDLQNAHDCLVVKKIKALLQEMKTNLKVYQRRMAEHQKAGRMDWVAQDLQVIASEQADIARWTAELKKAERACYHD